MVAVVYTKRLRIIQFFSSILFLILILSPAKVLLVCYSSMKLNKVTDVSSYLAKVHLVTFIISRLQFSPEIVTENY